MLEKAFWSLADVPWEILTDRELRTTRNRHLLRLQPYGVLRPTLLLVEQNWLHEFAQAAATTPGHPLRQIIELVAKRLGVSFNDGAELFYHGLWNGSIRGDLERPLSFSSTVGQMGISLR